MLKNIVVYAYVNDTKVDLSEIITELKFKSSLDNPYQEINFKIPYGIYTNSIPSYYIDTGTHIEIYDLYGEVRYRGAVNKVTINAKNQTLDILVYDYIYNLKQSTVYYNFKGQSAFECIKQILTDLQLQFTDDCILNGVYGEDSNIAINHIIKNKSAYDAIMMIATECHKTYGLYYYVYMDLAGNINITPCDKYWARQTIKSCTAKETNGNLLECNYTKDATDIVTKVIAYSSNGDEIDLETGEDN